MTRNRLAFWLDLSLLALVCALMVTRFTGLVIHEWAGVLIALPLVWHLLLQWPWIVARFRKLREPGAWRTRVNYAINTLLFISMVLVIQSGVMISRVFLADLEIAILPDRRWGQLHHWSADAMLWLVGLHLAINFDWVISAVRRRVRS